MNLVIQVLWAGVIAFVVVLAFTFACAQGTRARLDPVQRELQRRFETEAIEKALAPTPRRRAEHERRMVLLQIRMDFLRIQIVNDDLQTESREVQPDLRAIAKSASEITKSAERLKGNLALPGIKKGQGFPDLRVEMGVEQLRAALSLLSNSIGTFVENPVFEHVGVIDATLSSEALRDLMKIIEVSKQVKRGSEKLKRARTD
jgi:hypothetical protein